MRTYYDDLNLIRKFLEETKMNPHDLIRIAKDLCCCGKCKFFVAHYLADGTVTDFGHCVKNKIPKCVRPRDISCGYWLEGEKKND